MRALLLVAIVLIGVGCSTSFSNLTPAKALAPGDFQVSAQTQASIHSGVVGQTIDAGKAAREILNDDEQTEVDEAIVRDFIDGGLAWVLYRPGVTFELMVRAGVAELLEGLEVGLRYDTTVLKGDAKLQFWESESGRYALSALFGYGHHLSMVSSVAEYLTLTEWSRNDLDAQISFGIELGEYFKGWVNPRLITSRVSVSHKLPDFVREKLPDDATKYDPNQLFENEWMYYAGVTWGLMAGYKYVFIAFEMNTFQLIFKPTVLGEKRDFNSAVFAPNLGLVVTW